MAFARAGVTGRSAGSETATPATRCLTKSPLAGAASVGRTLGSPSGTQAPCWNAPILRGAPKTAQMIKVGAS